VAPYPSGISRLQPKSYTRIFISCDPVSLILQATGCAIASLADPTDQKQSDLGVHIMVAGLAFQVFSLMLFMALFLDFGVRVRGGKLGLSTPDSMHEEFKGSKRLKRLVSDMLLTPN
jgi:RTA1 like protein